MRKFFSWLKSLFQEPEIHAPPTKRPPYINYSNDYIIPIPGEGKNTYMYCFPIKGDYQKMQALVDQRLNFSPLSEEIRYFPLTSSMIMCMSYIKKGFTLDKSYTKYGDLEEKAMQIFMPLVECKKKNGEWSAQRIYIHIPYIFIDQPFSLSIGRELFGFSKSLGKFTIPDLPDEAKSFGMDAFGFKEFNKENPEFGAYHPLISIDKVDEQVAEKGEWKSHSEAWSHIKTHLDVGKFSKEFHLNLPFVFHELGDVFHKVLPMIFIKQFRDIEDPEKACYQAITTGNGITKAFHGGWFLGGKHEITINDMASFPIKDDLGLEDKIIVDHSFWLHADLEFDAGHAIWQSS